MAISSIGINSSARSSTIARPAALTSAPSSDGQGDRVEVSADDQGQGDTTRVSALSAGLDDNYGDSGPADPPPPPPTQPEPPPKKDDGPLRERGQEPPSGGIRSGPGEAANPAPAPPGGQSGGSSPGGEAGGSTPAKG